MLRGGAAGKSAQAWAVGRVTPPLQQEILRFRHVEVCPGKLEENYAELFAEMAVFL